MKSKAILKELSPYQQGKQTEEIKQEFQLDKVIKLASNENPHGFSKKLQQAWGTLNQELNIYPDGYTTRLRTALANHLNVAETQLVFGSGSDELIQIICRAFLYPGVNTIMATPTFPQYKHHALIEGAEVREIPTVDGYHDLESMANAIDEQTTVVWLCAPDNPTGTTFDQQQFTEFMSRCPKDVLVVLDQAYFEFVDEAHRLADQENLDTYDNLIILRTFSKAYGLAGIRVGYGITQEKIAKKLDVVRGPFNLTSIAENAALIALSDQEFIRETVQKNKQAKHKFQQFLDRIGWHYYETHTNFILVSTPLSGHDMFDYLIKHGYIIRPGDLLGYPNTIRITIGTEAQMEKLASILEELHHSLK